MPVESAGECAGFVRLVVAALAFRRKNDRIPSVLRIDDSEFRIDDFEFRIDDCVFRFCHGSAYSKDIVAP